MNKINVLLDYGTIVAATLNKNNKTGIYQVEYNILLEMLKNYSDKFNFFAYCDCGKNFYNNVILKEYPEFSSIKYLGIDNFCKQFKIYTEGIKKK